MRIYLIRHGETDYNKAAKLQGQIDIPLNDFGRTLAIETGEGLKNVNFDLCFTSPLSRAYETANLILKNRPTKIITDERLKEISFGIYEGYCCTPSKHEIPDSDFYNFFIDPSEYKVPQNGESIDDLNKRVKSFLVDLREHYDDKTILITTHGAVCKSFISIINQVPIKDFWKGGVHPNCAATIIDDKTGKWQIIEEGKIFYKQKVKNLYA